MRLLVQMSKTCLPIEQIYPCQWMNPIVNLGFTSFFFLHLKGWSDGAMVLGKLSVPGRPTICIQVGQEPTALAVGAAGGCLDMFSLIYPFSPLSPSLWETARYRLKYCLKGPLNPKQPANKPTNHNIFNFILKRKYRGPFLICK